MRTRHNGKKKVVAHKRGAEEMSPAFKRLPPNRTSDEAAAGHEDATRQTELRDTLNAPGQNPAPARPSRRNRRADEHYGDTEIPDTEK